MQCLKLVDSTVEICRRTVKFQTVLLNLLKKPTVASCGFFLTYEVDNPNHIFSFTLSFSAVSQVYDITVSSCLHWPS